MQRVGDLDNERLRAFLETEGRDQVGGTDLAGAVKAALDGHTGGADERLYLLYLGDGIAPGPDQSLPALRSLVEGRAVFVSVAVGDSVDETRLRGLADATWVGLPRAMASATAMPVEIPTIEAEPAVPIGRSSIIGLNKTRPRLPRQSRAAARLLGAALPLGAPRSGLVAIDQTIARLGEEVFRQPNAQQGRHGHGPWAAACARQPFRGLVIPAWTICPSGYQHCSPIPSMPSVSCCGQSKSEAVGAA